MKILHLCLSCFFIDGYSYQENILPKYHVKMGHNVTVVASLVSYDKDGHYCQLKEANTYNDPNGYKVIRLNYKHNNKVSKILRRYKGLSTILVNESPDIIFLHDISFLDIDKVITYKKQHPNVKIWADGHADYYNSARSFISKNILHKIIWRHCAQLLLPYVEKIWGTTPWRCIFMHEMYGIPNEKLDFLPMGVDDDAIPANKEEVRSRVRNELGVQNDEFLIFTGGKIDSKKNIHVLLEALKNINNCKIKVVICGVVTPEMKDIISSLVTPNVIMAGWCNAKQVIEYMLASDLACFPGTHSTLWEQSIGLSLPGIYKKWDNMTHINVCNNVILLEKVCVESITKAINMITTQSGYSAIKSAAVTASQSFLYSQISSKAIGV